MFFVKSLGEMCLKQLDDHCKKYAPLPDYQSAYRQSYSCETALVKLMNNVLWNMENSEVTAFTAIDLSVAFDTMDHNSFRCSSASFWCNRHAKEIV